MPATRLQFPQDLQDDTQGHCMEIKAKQQGTDTTLASVTLFIPGSSSGSNLIFGSKHEYAETKMSKIVGDAAFNATVGVGFGAVQTLGGMFGGVINPKVEVLYRDTDLRTFDFSFIMAPTSAEESKNLKEIAKTLRKYSSPTLIGQSDPRQGYIGAGGQFSYLSSGGIFKSPSEFVIDFWYKNEYGTMVINDNVPKIGRCVLEAVELMYNPNAEWSTFKDGNPLAAQLTMRFMEMRVIDSQNIQEGY